MKAIFSIFLVSVLLIISCNKDQYNYKKFIGDNEIIYAGLAEQIEARSGNLRVQLEWRSSIDPSVEKYIIYWNNYRDSGTLAASEIGADSIYRFIISDLPEYVQGFKMTAVNSRGGRSIGQLINSVRVYGPLYQATLLNRKFADITYFDGDSVKLSFVAMDSTLIYSRLRYIRADGQPDSIQFTEDEVTLPSFQLGSTPTIQSYYLPMPSAIDTFATLAADSLPALNGPTGYEGYLLTAELNASAALAGGSAGDFDSYMDGFGFDYTENPNCTGGYGGHNDGLHLETEWDDFLNKHVFKFNIHIDEVIDGDRCNLTTVDRQRNEMKSATNNSTWAKVQGNWDEWQRLDWKFKIPVGFQPTSSFGHLHQLKAQDGPNHGSPIITITARANSDGSNKRMQIIHTVDGASTGKGTIVDHIPLADFEGEWVSVQEEMHYTHNGTYSCKITRISDGKVLIDFTDDNIDMWRIGSSYVRNKYGIYRSLAGGRLDRNPVGQSPLLKDESLWLSDLKVYEKNTNPSPGTVHN